MAMMDFPETHDRVIAVLAGETKDGVKKSMDLAQRAGWFCVPMDVFMLMGGAPFVEELSKHVKVVLDVKIHENPSAAGRIIQQAGVMGAKMVTVHASGGSAMLHECRCSGRLNGVVPTAITFPSWQRSWDIRTLYGTDKYEDEPALAQRLARAACQVGVTTILASPWQLRGGDFRDHCNVETLIATRVQRCDDNPENEMSAETAVGAGADMVMLSPGWDHDIPFICRQIEAGLEKGTQKP